MAEENNKKTKKTTDKSKKKSRAAKVKETDRPTNKSSKEVRYTTHTGETLSVLQAKFIDKYIELGNQRQAVIQAGYKQKNPDWQANALLKIPKIADEIKYRMQQSSKKSIATAEEVMQYFSDVMQGKIKDQFGLDATLSDRTKAASELAKRLIDIPNKIEAIATGKGTGQATVTISLDWEGMGDTTDEGEEEQQEKE